MKGSTGISEFVDNHFGKLFVGWLLMVLAIAQLMTPDCYTSWNNLGDGTYAVDTRSGELAVVRQVIPTGDIMMSVCDPPEGWSSGTIHQRLNGRWIS